MSLTPLLPFVAAGLCVIVAVIAAIRARLAVADWMFVLGTLLLAGERTCSGLSLRAETIGDYEYWQLWRLTFLALVPGTWLIFSLTYARGNAALFMSRWRLTWIASLVLPLAIVTVFRSALTGEITNSDGVLRIGWAGVALYISILTISVLILLNLERTFRASVGTMRWRIKFMLMGVGLLFVVRIYTNSQTLIFHALTRDLETVNSVAIALAVIVMFRALIRSGHFEMGVYPSRSVIQGSVTALLTGVYLVVVGVFAKIAVHLGGDTGLTLKAFLLLVSLVLLAMLLQSDRVRLRLRQFISRNFQRPLYDYRTVWRNFTDGTASRVEQTDLCRSLVKLMADMFAALSVSIWLVDDKSATFTLAASTSVSDAKARDLGPRGTEAREVITYFQHHGEPVDVESRPDPWAEAVRRWSPSEFPHGGHRVCVPLIARGEVLGIIVLGDRVSGMPFLLQDFDMLKCAGDHGAANLLNVQLSQKLLAGKELEAFQTMAAFFVHDLKNAASTLNLTLQNLPVHFDNPEFRADALRALSKTANHINRLTGRLGLLRHELKIQPAERDLNEIVAAALTDLKTATPVVVTRDLQPVAKTLLDQEQLQKVIVNLVLNATEAIPTDGSVHIATKNNNGWVVLSVTDNGCGMTEEFLRKSLFRPFQTTKQHGLGIGMFQSNMIVEAHGGRIQVTSQVGQGSTFQIFLPVRSKTE